MNSRKHLYSIYSNEEDDLDNQIEMMVKYCQLSGFPTLTSDYGVLVDSGLSKQWWGRAIFYATTIRKRCTTGTFDNRERPYGRCFN